MLIKGTYVEIMLEVLQPRDRAENLPEETKKTSLKLWAKGHLIKDSEINETVQIKTVTGRVIEGVISEVNPSYNHGFGDFISELMYIGPQAKEILWGDVNGQV